MSIFMKNNRGPHSRWHTEKNMSDSPSSKTPNEIIEKKFWKRRKIYNNGAENRKGAISQPEIEIPGRQKADGIK